MSKRRKYASPVRVRLLAVILAPFELFREISVYPDFKGPAIVFSLYALGYSAVLLVTGGKAGLPPRISLALLPTIMFYVVLLWVFVTLVYWGLARILGGHGSLKSLFSATGYAQLVGAITVFVLAAMYAQMPAAPPSAFAAWAGSPLASGVVLLSKLLMTFLRMLAVDACYGLGRGRSVASGAIAFLLEILTPPFNQLV